MRIINLKIVVCLFLPILAACQVPLVGTAPTALPTATGTLQPTLTLTPAPTATGTPLPTETLDPVRAMHPEGTPVAEWQDIPIMPGAIAGQENQGGYTFTIQATPEEIQKYYDRELVKLGWTSFATGQGANGPAMLMYVKDKDSLTVGIIVSGDECLVLIVL
jgi:hypothetical protein